MPMQPYICIAESVYDGKASWKAWGMEFMDLSPAEAASAFVACRPKECGVGSFPWGNEEPTSVLAKNADSGEIVRVLVETELRVVVTEAAVDKSFISPKE